MENNHYDNCTIKLNTKIIEGKEYLFNEDTEQHDIEFLTLEQIEQNYGVGQAYSDTLRIFAI